MRRIFASLATVSVLLLNLISSPAHATGYDGTSGTVACSTSGTFTILNNVVTDRLNCTGDVVLPTGVTSIGDSAFSAAGSISSIFIPATVISIGSNTFSSATSLATVTFEASSQLTSIGDGAFSGATALATIVIPAGVTSIGNYSFSRATSLATVTFEASSQLASIGNYAFSQTTLTLVSIPASVASIGASAFGSASSLSSIVVAIGNANYSDVDGVLFNFDKSLLIQYPIGRTAASYSVPAGVTALGASAFKGAASLTSITIPAGVTSIGQSAFENTTALASITIPAGVTSIGQSAFENATALATITIPASVTSIQYGTFYGATALNSVIISAGVTTIEDYAFYGAASLGSLAVPASVTSINRGAFESATSLLSVTFEANSMLTSIGQAAFRNTTSLTSISIPTSVTAIGDSAFSGATALNSVYFFGNAPTIGTSAFGTIAANPNAYIKSGATGFAAVGDPWNGLTIGIGVYTVSFDSNSGSAVSSDLFASGGLVSAPTPPTKSGNTFAGWSATNGGSALSFPYSPIATSNITLYALWTSIPVSSSPTPVSISDEEVAAAEKEIASRTVLAKKKYSIKSLAKRAGVTLNSPKAKVSMKVAKASKKICTISGTKLKTLKVGKCKVIFTVQEPKSKKGKKPKATKTTKVLIVNKRVSLT